MKSRHWISENTPTGNETARELPSALLDSTDYLVSATKRKGKTWCYLLFVFFFFLWLLFLFCFTWVVLFPSKLLFLTLEVQHGHQTHQDHVYWGPVPHQRQESLQGFNSMYDNVQSGHNLPVNSQRLQHGLVVRSQRNLFQHVWPATVSLCCARRWFSFTSRTP